MPYRFFSIFIFFSNTLFAQTQSARPQWGSLQPGPYSVGYKTIRFTDYTRNYFPDAAGRPMQIYMWYPAQATNAKPMQYADYFADIGYDWGKSAEAEKLREYLIAEFKNGPISQAVQGPLKEAAWQKILQTPVPSLRDALPATGKFPVLLHQHGNGALVPRPANVL